MTRRQRSYVFVPGRAYAFGSLARVNLTAGASRTWHIPQTTAQLIATVREVDPRYVFFVNWSARVPWALVEAFECVNFHCTALPYGRGGHPIENLILRGHTETVITAHRMTDEIDAGPIYGQSDPVSLAGTKDEILARFSEPIADLMTRIIETEPAPVPQAGEVVTFRRLPQTEYEAFWKAREA